ncbi:MAG: hypothetical protein EX285_01210 [Thaumarchaeota archaeon]|nr:hypothetical protein [Nitrososphaerota archaeon]
MLMYEIIIEFPDLNEKIDVELDDVYSPKTVKAILEKLPINTVINRWGDELYTEPIPVKAGLENAKSTVNLMDVAYWPQGNALCLFFGPTPISKSNEIKPYSPVNVIGRIVSKENAIKKINDSTKVIIRK